MRALRLLPSFAFSLAIAVVAGDQDMSLVSSLDLKEGAPILPSLTSLVSVPWETCISSLAGLEQGTSELLKQGLSPECGTACSLGLAGLAGATIYSLYSRCWKVVCDLQQFLFSQGCGQERHKQKTWSPEADECGGKSVSK